MLTVKQGGLRVVNPDLTTSQTEDFEKDSLFKILVVECGFMASPRQDVWTHTKDDKFSVQLDSSKGIFLFEYRYTSDQVAYPKKIDGVEFISRFLESSRNFFHLFSMDKTTE